MKSYVRTAIIAILIIGTNSIIQSCKKDTTPPFVGTTNVSEITQTTALIAGAVTNYGGAEITEIGVCWDTSPNPTIGPNKIRTGTDAGHFTTTISGLTANTKYYVRAYAISSTGTSYGNGFTFTTKEIFIAPGIIFNSSLTYGTVSDIDGNDYKNIQIGNQVWMAENLRTTKLNDGTLIPNITSTSAWGNSITPAYSWYDNEVGNKDAYGALYNWFTVKTGKLCPAGWHVPSDVEWATLITYLGGENIAVGKLMEAGITHWLNPNTGATNESGFTGLPGGLRFRDIDGEYIDYPFDSIGYWGFWWSASEYSNAANSWITYIVSWESNETRLTTLIEKGGASVRCLKDN